jgi:hypothetical protein
MLEIGCQIASSSSTTMAVHVSLQDSRGKVCDEATTITGFNATTEEHFKPIPGKFFSIFLHAFVELVTIQEDKCAVSYVDARNY